MVKPAHFAHCVQWSLSSIAGLWHLGQYSTSCEQPMSFNQADNSCKITQVCLFDTGATCTALLKDSHVEMQQIVCRTAILSKAR